MKEIKEILSISEWEDILRGKEGVQSVIFKNSPYCPVSAIALREFTKFAANVQSNRGVKLYLVDVIKSRSISNRISEDLGIIHQSPQLIWLDEKGNVLDHKSHTAITFEYLNKLLQKGDKK